MLKLRFEPEVRKHRPALDSSPPSQPFATGSIPSFPAFCLCRLEAVTDSRCRDCFCAHRQVRSAYHLRLECVADHLLSPPSSDPRVEDHAVCAAILKRAQSLRDPHLISQLVERWPFLLDTMTELLTAADETEQLHVLQQQFAAESEAV